MFISSLLCCCSYIYSKIGGKDKNCLCEIFNFVTKKFLEANGIR